MAARLGMAHQELQEWRSNNKDNCSACATAPFDHGLLEQWLDKVKEKQPNFPKEFIIQSNSREERNLLQGLKNGIRSVCAFSTFLHEHGCPESVVFPACTNFKGLVREHWESGRPPYCSDACARPPCADGCGAARPEGTGNRHALYHNWEGAGNTPWIAIVEYEDTDELNAL